MRLIPLIIVTLTLAACAKKSGGTCEGDSHAKKQPTAVSKPAQKQVCPKAQCACPKTDPAQKSATPSAAAQKAVLAVIHSRKSVRHYLKKQVPTVMLEHLARAGMAAPTAINKQPWAFMILTDRKILDELGDKLPYARMIKQTPAAIVVAGDMKLALPGKLKDFWVQDVSAAVENVLLAAEAMGLGAVWTGVYPMEKQLKVVTDVLKLPAHIIPLAVIPVGWPSGVDKPKQKWDAKKLHWNRWGDNGKPSLISP